MDTTDIPAEQGTPICDVPPSDTPTPALVPSTPPPADEVPPSPARPFWRAALRRP